MICPVDGCCGDVRITHTFSAGNAGKTQDGICTKCRRRVVAITVLHLRGETRVRGEGGRARALRLRQEADLAKQRRASPF